MYKIFEVDNSSLENIYELLCNINRNIAANDVICFILHFKI